MKLNEKILQGLTEATYKTNPVNSINTATALLKQIKNSKLDGGSRGFKWSTNSSNKILEGRSDGSLGGAWEINITKIDDVIKSKVKDIPAWAIDVYVNDELIASYEEITPVSILHVLIRVINCQDELIKIQKEMDPVIKLYKNEIKKMVMPKYGA